MKHEGTWDFLKQVFHSTKILNFGALFTDGTPQDRRIQCPLQSRMLFLIIMK